MSSGAVRDLFKKFAESREKAHGGRYKKRTFGGDGIEMQRMEEGRIENPDWMDVVHNVKGTIATLQDHLQQLSDAQVNQLKGGDNLFALEEEQNQRDQVDILNKKIGKLFSNANGMVKRLCDPNVGSQEDLKKHKEFLRALSDQRSRVDDTGFKFTPPEDDDDADSDATWSQAQVQEIGTMDRIIDERDKEITKIAQSVSELAQLFRELSVMVIDQGTVLDRIDYNMEEVVVNFEQAEEELEETEKIINKGYSAYCILILCVMCIIMASILAIKKSSQKS